MNSNAYNLDELVEVLRPDWPLVSKRTIHFYASKGIIRGRRRGRGAEYNESDRLRLLAAVRMRESGEKLKDIAARIGSMNHEAIEKYLREPWSPRPIVRNITHYMKDGTNRGRILPLDERVINKENRPETWSRIPLADGVELALRTDVTLSERLPAIIDVLQNLTNH